MERPDPVTPSMARAVMDRDTTAAIKALQRTGLSGVAQGQYFWKHPVCVAPILDPSQWEKCSGRSTLDHVKDEPMMGKRAPSDAAHLVTLCEYHHLWTHRGQNWATSHRPQLRAYLGGGHVESIVVSRTMPPR